MLDTLKGVDYTALAIGSIQGGRSSVGLERRPVTPEVAGSSPVAPAIIVASFGLFQESDFGFIVTA